MQCVKSSVATPRARAAWAYSLLSQQDLAARCPSVGYHRLRAICGEADETDVELEELYEIAEAAGVPPLFMDEGFERLEDSMLQETLDRVRKLEERLQAVENRPAFSTEQHSALVGLALVRAARDAAQRKEARLRAETARGRRKPSQKDGDG